jgi:hypothetical protein
VITPDPLAKTPVRVALAPTVIEVEAAVKLEIDGGGGGGGVVVLDDPPPQLVEIAVPRLRTVANETRAR